jgi:peptidoglycan/xylan/chitin deacetylase (PgdA/CDA1 family)
MGWDTIRDLAREGVAFGAHTVSHPVLTRVGPARMREELGRSREELEDRLGRPVETLAYPFGFHDDLVRNTAAAAGFRAAVTTHHARSRLGDDLLACPGSRSPGGRPGRLRADARPRRARRGRPTPPLLAGTAAR